jgi:lysophospholipase L1-like esterase
MRSLPRFSVALSALVAVACIAGASSVVSAHHYSQPVSCPDSKTALSNPPGANTFVVGDSLTYGEWCWAKTAAAEYNTREQIARLDARVGRFTSTGVSIVKSVPPASLPSRLVFALGTNDLASGYSASSYRQKLNDVIAYAGQNKNVHVYLVTVRTSKNLTLTRAYNEQIVQAAVLRPNVHVIDWASQVTSSISASDGVHLNVTGYRMRAAYIAARVANCVNRADYAAYGISFCQ